MRGGRLGQPRAKRAGSGHRERRRHEMRAAAESPVAREQRARSRPRPRSDAVGPRREAAPGGRAPRRSPPRASRTRVRCTATTRPRSAPCSPHGRRAGGRGEGECPGETPTFGPARTDSPPTPPRPSGQRPFARRPGAGARKHTCRPPHSLPRGSSPRRPHDERRPRPRGCARRARRGDVPQTPPRGRRTERYWTVGHLDGAFGRSVWVRLRPARRPPQRMENVAVLVMLRTRDWVPIHSRSMASRQHDVTAFALDELDRSRASPVTDAKADRLEANRRRRHDAS